MALDLCLRRDDIQSPQNQITVPETDFFGIILGIGFGIGFVYHLAFGEGNRMFEYRSIETEGVEFPIFATGINAFGEVIQK